MSAHLSPSQIRGINRAYRDERRLFAVPVPPLRRRRRPLWLRLLLGALGYAAGGVLVAWVLFAGIDWFWRVLGLGGL